MIFIATQVWNARLKLAQSNDLPGAILRRSFRFTKGTNALPYDFGIAPTVTSLESQQGLSRILIQTGMYDICHAVYNTQLVYRAARREPRQFA